MKEIILNVKGMSCSHCINSIEKALNQLEDIGTVNVI